MAAAEARDPAATPLPSAPPVKGAGDAVGGLLNATLGNLTELVIALTALRAGHFQVHGVKSPIAQIDFAGAARMAPPRSA